MKSHFSLLQQNDLYSNSIQNSSFSRKASRIFSYANICSIDSYADVQLQPAW